MGRGSNESYNMVSIVFLALSALVCALTLLILGDVVPAGPLEPATEVPTATLALAADGRLPTFTPSDTPIATRDTGPSETPSITPTWTGMPTNTFTPSASPTGTNTATGTATFTLSPTWTFTPSATFTVTPTWTSTSTIAPPAAGQPPAGGTGATFTTPPSFPLLRDAFTHPGCQWQGIGGQVNGTQGPLPGITIKVTNPDGTTLTAVSGTAPDYGQSGWEIQVASAPTAGTYQVQVVAADQVTPLSNALAVQFTGTCEQSLAVVNFIQVQ